MSPRKYDMSRRAAAAAETRRRIVEATFEVHDEQGIAGARLEDIARRAGVSVGTLYRHFRRYEDLIAACGALTYERMPPPTAGSARAALAAVTAPRRRVELLVSTLFGFYEQTGPMVQMLRQDSAALPILAESLSELEAGFDAWVAEALTPLHGLEPGVVRALVDHRTWTALVEQGVADPASVVVGLIDCSAGGLGS